MTKPMDMKPGDLSSGSGDGRTSSVLLGPAIGNVNRFAALPPGTDPPSRTRKGTPIFDACFESGNLGRVDWISDHEYDLFIRPDTCNSRFRVWFNFTVSNVAKDQRVIFNVVNFSKNKSLYREGMSPMVKSSSRPRWQRVASKNVFYYRSPEHHKNYVMSFAFCFDREEVYQFAYSYPYTYTRLQGYLDMLDKRHMDFYTRELLAVTVQQRRVDLVTITHPRNLHSKSQTKVIFVTSRVHPGETPASYVVQGLLDFLVSFNPLARLLREHLVFKLVPMLNPDGVYLGNYRTSLMGFDLNRQWLEPSPWAHPSLFAVRKLLTNMDSTPGTSVDFYIDIHAHSTLMNGFMYGNAFDDDERFDKQSIFPKLLCNNSEDFSLTNTNYNRDVVKAGTGRRCFGGSLDERVLSYTLEVSLYCYLNANHQVVPYTEEAYVKLGHNLGRTFVDYYRVVGLFTPSMIPVERRRVAPPRKAPLPANKPPVANGNTYAWQRGNGYRADSPRGEKELREFEEFKKKFSNNKKGAK